MPVGVLRTTHTKCFDSCLMKNFLIRFHIAHAHSCLSLALSLKCHLESELDPIDGAGSYDGPSALSPEKKPTVLKDKQSQFRQTKKKRKNGSDLPHCTEWPVLRQCCQIALYAGNQIIKAAEYL
jgi:hypothetical protein